MDVLSGFFWLNDFIMPIFFIIIDVLCIRCMLLQEKNNLPIKGASYITLISYIVLIILLPAQEDFSAFCISQLSDLKYGFSQTLSGCYFCTVLPLRLRMMGITCNRKTFLSDEWLLLALYWFIVSLRGLVSWCLSVQWFVFTFIVLDIVKPQSASLWANNSLRGFKTQTVFGSNLLIINLDQEKVTAGLPGVTVTVATLINILLLLIGWLGRGRAVVTVFNVTVLQHSICGHRQAYECWYVSLVRNQL